MRYARSMLHKVIQRRQGSHQEHCSCALQLQAASGKGSVLRCSGLLTQPDAPLDCTDAADCPLLPGGAGAEP